MKGRLLFFIFFLTIECLFAQWRPPQMHHFGAVDGLTSGVRDMDQDGQGYMYFATDQGMYRYDGSVFDFYGHDSSDSTSISSGHVFDLHVSKNGKIYLVMFGPYLNSFDPVTQQFERFKLPENKNFDSQFGNSIAEDMAGNIWIGGENYQLFKFDPNTKKFNTYSVPWIKDSDKNGRYAIRKVFQNPYDENILWLSVPDEKPLDNIHSAYGLVQFKYDTKDFSQINGAGKIQLVDQSKNRWGTLWAHFITEVSAENTSKVHSYQSLYDSLPKSKQKEPKVSMDLVEYQGNKLIAARDVLSLNNKNEFEFFYKYNDGIEATNLFVDRSDNLWVGLTNGVDVYSAQDDQIFFYSLSDLGEDKRIYPGRIAYNADNQSFYLVGSTSKNLSKVYKIPHPKYFKTKPAAIDLPVVPQAIAQKSKQSIIVSGGGKMWEIDTKTNKVRTDKSVFGSNQNVPFLYKFISDNSDWVVGFGFDKIIWWSTTDQKQKQIRIGDLKGSKEKDFFTNVQFNGKNELIVTTRSNAFLFDLETEKTQRFELQMDIPFQYITGLSVDKNHNIWISSMSELVRFSKKGLDLKQESIYALKDGIRSPTIQEIYIDQHGKIWIFHQSGMDCLNPVTNEIRNISSREGLPHTTMDPVQIIETDDGYLATNCGNGLIIWHPDSLWNSLTPPSVPLVIQSLQVNGKLLNPNSHQNDQSEYTLPNGPKVVNIKFQGLAYPTDKNVKYSYRFTNQDSNWISTGTNNQLILSELPYGDNFLEIKSGDPKVTAPSVKAFIYNPTPLLANPWFYAVLAAFVLGGLYLLYKWRIGELRKKEEQKTYFNKKVAELELTALRSQMNPHFMFNSLNSIKTYILEAKPDIAADYLSQFSHLIRRILQNSREKNISLEEELETLTLYVQLEQFRFDHAFEFKVDIDPTIHLSDIMIPPMLLQPFIENAIWHGLMHKDDSGILGIEFIQNGGYISCIIDDNGIGREKAKELKSLSARKYKSMGMNITQNRVQLLNTIDSLGITLDIIDKYNQENIPTGTKVILKIPISTDE